jgi:vitamin B12 transporter
MTQALRVYDFLSPLSASIHPQPRHCSLKPLNSSLAFGKRLPARLVLMGKQKHMLQKFILSLVLSIGFLTLQAQILITGIVKDQKKNPLPGASVAIQNSYYGTTSGSDGRFAFTVTDTGRQTIVISILEYETIEQEIWIGKQTITLNPVMKETITELKAVTISAGSFEASDKKRTTVLKSIDIVTSAGQQADIVSALQTLPGAQQVGETEGLFVRGGTGAETKVFIDGMMVANPFYSSVPDIAQRGRFSPLLFKGTTFSSGGYSAMFGQALSSALVLESLDIPTRTESNWIISSAQMSVTGQRVNKAKNGSIGGGIIYNNLAPYFSVVKQKYNYTKAPEIFNTELHARQKTKNGMFKFYGYGNYSTIALDRPGVDHINSLEQFRLVNKNIYTNLTYTGQLSEKWKLYAGVSLSVNKDDIRRYEIIKDTVSGYFLPKLYNLTQQARLVFSRNLSGISKIHIGAEAQEITDKINAKDSIPFISIHDNYLASFAEAEIYITTKFAARAGARLEYSSLLKETKVSPRLSLAYKLSATSQLSAALGNFYQKPEINYLFRTRQLSFTRATHYIFNYQYIANGRTLRLELYHKQYHQLISYFSGQSSGLSNNGTGYAKGIEFFWRDKKTVKGLDYWVSYSYLDTKRRWLDYPFNVQPGFAATHTASLVVKKFVDAISTHFSMSYTYASGRPYYNPNRPLKDFMKDRTIDFNTMGFQVNYLTQFGKAYTVLIFNMSNVIGNRQVYSYRFANTPDADGHYGSEAITPMAKRFFFVGVYISIGNDRRKQVID